MTTGPALTSQKVYVALAAFQAGDAVACAIPLPFITKSLEAVQVPTSVHPMLAGVKAASAVGLLSVFRFPALARLTTAMLAFYFVLAVGAHIRVRDRVVNTIPAAAFLAMYVLLTAKGPQCVGDARGSRT